MITRFLKKKYAQAMSVNLKVESNTYDKSWYFKFTGFNDKIETLVEMVMVDLKDFNNDMDPKIFESCRTQMKKQYYNYLRDVEALNGEFLKEILYEKFHHDHELLQEVDKVSFEHLQKFLLKFFSKLKIHVLVQGNIRKSQALNVVKILQENISCQPLDGAYEIRNRIYQLPMGTTALRVKSLNVDDDNSETSSYYQIGPETLRTRSLTILAVSILDSKAFDYLRNKEQLGYSVGIRLYQQSGVLGIAVSVSSQEHKHSFTKVYSKIETFMTEIAKDTIETLADEEFEQFKESRVKMLTAGFSSLSEETTANWAEITREDYVFDREDLMAKVTKALTKTELQEFFRSFTQPENIRKLAVQVIGNQNNDGAVSGNSKDQILKIDFMSEKLSEDENVLTDLAAFQSQAILYPTVKFEI